MTTCPHCQIGLPKQQQYREKRIYVLRKAKLWRGHRRCHYCNLQAVERTAAIRLNQEELMQSLLLERVSLRAIARILQVSLGWVVKRAKQYWQSS